MLLLQRGLQEVSHHLLMGLSCLKPLPVYRPRDPRASDLWRVLDGHFATFREVYDERFQAKYGFWRPVVDRAVAAFLKCGDLQEGFARVRCPDVVPGMVSGIHTHGELLHWHPHIHALVTCGAFTPEGVFLELPEFDMASLLRVWQEAVFALYLAEGKIEAQVVENMRTWRHTGFSIDQSVFLPAGDHKGIERLVQYITRCPFSLSRLVKVTGTGQVVLKAEKAACRAFPDPKGDGRSSPL